MLQQRLASKHYRLRDSKLAEGRSASGRRRNNNNNKNTGKLRTALGPMAARLKMKEKKDKKEINQR